MKNVTAQIEYAKQRPMLFGLFAILAVVLLGAGIAFATGLTSPSKSYADDFSSADFIDTGSFSDFSGGSADFTDTGSIGDFLGSGADFIDTNPVIDNIPTTVDTGSVVIDTSPCSGCDNADFIDTNPKLDTIPTAPNDSSVVIDTPPCSDCGGDNSSVVIDTPPCSNCGGDNNSSVVIDTPPCNCDSTPPVIDVIPPPDVPIIPVVPIIIPPVTPVCAEGQTGTYPHCVTPPPPPAQPECIALTGTPHSISSGDAVTLAWQTKNATSITIDNGVGAVTPVAAGSKVVHPTTSTTYKATVKNAAGSVNCQTSVVVTTTPPPPPGPSCVQLTASATSIDSGDAVTLSWVTSNAVSVSIDNGVGSVTPVASGSTVVHPTSATTYNATVPGAAINPACSVTVTIQTHGGGCTTNCGGGGGGGGGGGSSGGHGYSGGSIIPQLPVAIPASMVYLSQIPYTGLDLGPVGTVVYWALLILWCIAAAYLVVFMLIPFIYGRMHRFGTNVGTMLNAPAGVSHDSHDAHDTHDSAHGHQYISHAAPVPSNPSAYSAVQGFRSFAQGEALTIDDIVNGLARLPETEEASVAKGPATYHSAEEVITSHAAPHANPAPHVASTRTEAAARAISTDVRDFCAALLAGNRDAVFGTIRQIVREGGDAEMFITQVVCGLDDAYRNRLDGTPVNAEIARLTEGCATSFLERLTGALTNAVDSSYSPGITGSKLALTRALAVVEG